KIRRDGGRVHITKYILRKAFANKTPAEILGRKKLGFPVPLRRLFEHELREMSGDVFESRALRESGLFKTENLATLLRQQEAGIDHSAQLWSLLVFCLWLEQFRVTA